MNKNKLMTGAVSIALAVTMLSTTAFAAATSFTDVDDNHWAAPSIAEMSDRGVMTGVGGSQFAPDKTLSNAEFVTMVVRQFYADKVGSGGDKWYSPYLDVATSAGIWSGVAEDTINRYDMARLIYKVMQNKGMTTTPLPDTFKVADWEAIPVDYRDAVSVCYNMGMLTGVDGAGTFNGMGSMNRAQAAVVMDRMIDSQASNIPDPAPPASAIPDGALELTDTNVKIRGDGSSYADGVFTLQNSGFEGTGGYIKFTNKGYTTLTFTVTVGDALHKVTVVGADGINGDLRLLENQIAGTSVTYTADISGIKAVQVRVFSGRTCDATVTNIYLS